MKIPKTIRIKNYEKEKEFDWRVDYKWRLNHDGEDCHGLCVSSRRNILILHGLSSNEQRLVFLHELCHAVIAENVDSPMKTETEELIVDSLSRAIDEMFYLRIKK